MKPQGPADGDRKVLLTAARSYLIKQHGPLPKTPWGDYDVAEIGIMMDDSATIIRRLVKALNSPSTAANSPTPAEGTRS